MKQPMSFSLRGEEWYKLYYAYWVPSLLLVLLSLIRKKPASLDWGTLGGDLALTLAIVFLQMLVQAYFMVPFLRTWFPRLTVGKQSPTFRGDTTDYLKLNVVGFLLSLVTLGIYLPWYARSVWEYLAGETSYAGARARFLGRSSRLLGQSLVWALASFGFLMVVVLLFIQYGGDFASRDLKAATTVVTAVTFFLVLLLMAPFLVLVYQWTVHFGWNDLVVRWKTGFWSSTVFVTGQVLLCGITLGLYLPAAVLRVLGYFARRTVVEKDGAAVVVFGFDGKVFEGFVFLWGQMLLTVVTLGFYYPWAFGKAAGWVAGNLWTEEVSVAAPVLTVEP